MWKALMTRQRHAVNNNNNKKTKTSLMFEVNLHALLWLMSQWLSLSCNKVYWTHPILPVTCVGLPLIVTLSHHPFDRPDRWTNKRHKHKLCTSTGLLPLFIVLLYRPKSNINAETSKSMLALLCFVCFYRHLKTVVVVVFCRYKNNIYSSNLSGCIYPGFWTTLKKSLGCSFNIDSKIKGKYYSILPSCCWSE